MNMFYPMIVPEYHGVPHQCLFASHELDSMVKNKTLSHVRMQMCALQKGLPMSAHPPFNRHKSSNVCVYLPGYHIITIHLAKLISLNVKPHGGSGHAGVLPLFNIRFAARLRSR